MSLYLPNPCLLGIIFTICTHNGPQLVFHYPANPNSYGFQATPTSLEDTNLVYSSDSSDDDEAEEDDDYDRISERDEEVLYDDLYRDGTDFSSNGSFSSHRNSNTNSNPNFKFADTYNALGFSGGYNSGKVLLDMLDKQDRRRQNREKRRKKLLKHIFDNFATSDTPNDPLGASNSAQANSEASGNYSGHPVDSDDKSSTHHTKQSSPGDSGPWNSVFGFSGDFISEIVSPGRGMCNSRFEITIDDVSFLGLPIHVLPDGSWRVRKHKQPSHPAPRSVATAPETSETITESNENSETVPRASSPISGITNGLSTASIRDGVKNDSNTDTCPMTMFNVSFVMNPPTVEYRYRTDEMYHYISSRLSLLLRAEQARSNYVWEEACKLLKLREEAAAEHISMAELWNRMLQQSSLALAISQIYESVVRSSIATVSINGRIRSFQIPIQTEFASLPLEASSLLAQTIPGSFLSLAAVASNGAEDPDDSIMKHCAILLLDKPDNIIEDIKTERDGLIADFIRSIDPTESLQRLAGKSGLDLAQIQSFAYHLIYWRRARAILPIHTRNVYVVSPMAPIANFPQHSGLFRTQFPSLPSLAGLLSLLSGTKPRQLSTLIPSRDHRDIYLEATKWLLRYGYITQLQTFLWIRISREIKIAVEEELELQAMATASSTAGKKPEKKTNTDTSTDNSSKQEPRRVSELSKGLKKGSLLAAQDTENKNDVTFYVEDNDDTILKDPERATALERRWISKCLEGQPADLIALFGKLMKYMNGKYPIELILVKENVSRQELRRLLLAVEKHVISVRHW